MAATQPWSALGWTLTVASAATLALAACTSRPPSPVPPAASVRVTGRLMTNAGGDRIALPDVPIRLVDAGGNRLANSVTQLDGRFMLHAPTVRAHLICYDLPSGPACGSALKPGQRIIEAGQIVAAATPVLYGQVLTGDGRPCWVADSFFGLDVSTRVSAVQAGRPAVTARANTDGYYALFAIPQGNVEVTARCEAAQATRAGRSGAGVKIDFTLPNRAPVIATAAAFAGAVGRTQSTVGEALDLRATAADPDGDTIRYLWRGLPQAGQIAAATGPATTWQLPGAPGLVSAYLIASDGKGGYAYRRVDMEVAKRPTIAVSGTAIDESTRLPISGAVVSVGQVSTRTDERGWFTLDAAPRDDSRYVLNLRQGNYALASRVVDGSRRGVSFEMTAAQVTQAAPGEPMRIVDRGSAGFCGSVRGAAGEERRPLVRWAPGLELLRASIGETFSRPDREEKPCMRRGAEISIPAGALVDARGNAASGAVRAAVTTLNPARRPLPGDYSALTRGGELVSLLSYGAVDVQLTDSSGQALNLRPGSRAEVRIPVPPDQEASVRPKMPMWSYDSTRGRWIEEGEAVLERGPDGVFYRGETQHFSTINIDFPGWTLANITCLRVDIDPNFNAWTDKVLRAYVNYGGTSLQVQEVEVDSPGPHAVYTIPWGTTLPHNTVRLELRGTDASNPNTANVQLLFDQVIDTDVGQTSPLPEAFPPSPYLPCQPVSITAATTLIPYYALDALGRPAFLAGPFGYQNPASPDTAAYYAKLGKPNLSSWWAANGFDPFTGQPNDPLDPGHVNYSEAAYMNHNELGLGRRLQCRAPSTAKLACFVVNFGRPDQNPGNADLASANTLSQQVGTLAMEFDSSIPDPDYAVQFFAYQGSQSSSQTVGHVDLDGFGPKPVPYVCTVCHGGAYDSINHWVWTGRFREFDLPALRYPNGKSWDFPATAQNLPPPEIDKFAQLNRRVHDALGTLPAPTPTRDLIASWYPNGFGGGAGNEVAPIFPPKPGTWGQLPASAHDEVFAKSCRGCHFARDYGLGKTFQNYSYTSVFDDWAYFRQQPSRDAVCGVVTTPSPQRRRTMPNAIATYRNFWASAVRVQAFESLFLIPSGTCRF